MPQPEPGTHATMQVRLRERTRTHHQRAESALNVSRGFASLAGYGALLQMLFGLYAGYERVLNEFDWESTGINFESRRRELWLLQDLRALGLANSLPVPPQHHITSLAEAIGAMYVLEGSTLGGQILSRQALLLPQITRVSGARFFTGHGARTSDMWAAFVSAMNDFAERTDADAHIELGAVKTFDEFTRQLTVTNQSEPTSV